MPELDGWLIRERRLWARRAPGNTCLSALRLADTEPQAANNSKGCGTVMRDAPFGLIFNPEQAFTEAVSAAWTTHGHPSARYSSGALAVIVAYLMRGEVLPRAVEQAIDVLRHERESEEVVAALRGAVVLSTAPDWRDRLPELGEGWVAEEALAIAVLCALAAPDAEEAIIAAVNHGGDSDSAGSITGNIVGALHGPDCLPAAWTGQVEMTDVIRRLSADLDRIVSGGAASQEYWTDYPGW